MDTRFDLLFEEAIKHIEKLLLPLTTQYGYHVKKISGSRTYMPTIPSSNAQHRWAIGDIGMQSPLATNNPLLSVFLELTPDES